MKREIMHAGNDWHDDQFDDLCSKVVGLFLPEVCRVLTTIDGLCKGLPNVCGHIYLSLEMSVYQKMLIHDGRQSFNQL